MFPRDGCRPEPQEDFVRRLLEAGGPPTAPPRTEAGAGGGTVRRCGWPLARGGPEGPGLVVGALGFVKR